MTGNTALAFPDDLPQLFKGQGLVVGSRHFEPLLETFLALVNHHLAVHQRVALSAILGTEQVVDSRFRRLKPELTDTAWYAVLFDPESGNEKGVQHVRGHDLDPHGCVHGNMQPGFLKNLGFSLSCGFRSQGSIPDSHADLIEILGSAGNHRTIGGIGKVPQPTGSFGSDGHGIGRSCGHRHITLVSVPEHHEGQDHGNTGPCHLKDQVVIILAGGFLPLRSLEFHHEDHQQCSDQNQEENGNPVNEVKVSVDGIRKVGNRCRQPKTGAGLSRPMRKKRVEKVHHLSCSL